MNEAKIRNSGLHIPVVSQQFGAFPFDRFNLFSQAATISKSMTQPSSDNNVHAPLDLSQKSSRSPENHLNAILSKLAKANSHGESDPVEYKQYSDDYEQQKQSHEEEPVASTTDENDPDEEAEQEDAQYKSKDEATNYTFNSMQSNFYMNFYNNLKNQLQPEKIAPSPKKPTVKQETVNTFNLYPNYLQQQHQSSYYQQSPNSAALAFLSQLPQSHHLTAALSILSNQQNFLRSQKQQSQEPAWPSSQDSRVADNLNLNLFNYFNNAFVDNTKKGCDE